jgi:hypothetical protein
MGLGNPENHVVVNFFEEGFHRFYLLDLVYFFKQFPKTNLNGIRKPYNVIREVFHQEIYENEPMRHFGFVRAYPYGEVCLSHSKSGYGPYIYTAAMKHVDHGICPDQSSLSVHAKRLWRRFYKEAASGSIELTPTVHKYYPRTPYRNFYYKIHGDCLSDQMVERGREFIAELRKMV